MKKQVILIGLLGVLAVSIGAFGAHGLRPRLDAKTMHAFETAVSYHFYHIMALMFCAYLKDRLNIEKMNTVFNLFVIGIILFSGSLYGIAFARAGGYDLSFLGPITPVGGVFFIVAWAMMAYFMTKKVV